MKKTLLFTILLLLLMSLSSCMFLEDNINPKFNKAPTIEGENKGIYSKKLGDIITINIDVEDNQGIQEISVYKSGDTVPFTKLVEKSNNKEIKRSESIYLPPSKGFYSLNIKVIDTNGNAVTAPVKSGKDIAKFMTEDDIKPTLLEGFEKNVELGEDFSFKFQDKGEGIESIKIFVNGELQEGNYVIESKNYWQETGTYYIKNKFTPGTYEFVIKVKDKFDNEKQWTKNITVVQRGEGLDDLQLNLDYPNNIVPNTPYTITIDATSNNYIEDVLFDGISKYGNSKTKEFKDNVYRNGVDRTSGIIEHEIKLIGCSSEKTEKIKINIKQDENPDFEYFDIYKINGEQLIPIEKADICPNDQVMVKFKVVDDIALDKVVLNYGRDGIKSFNNFKNYKDSNEYNEYYEGEEIITVDSNNFNISLYVKDKKGNYIDYKSNSLLKKTIMLKDTSTPVISSISLIHNNREINGVKTFKVVQNADIFFNIKIERKQTKIKNVEIRVNRKTLAAKSSANPFIFKTDTGYPIPSYDMSKNRINFDIFVEDEEGNTELKTGYEIIIFENESDIYIPNIKTNIIDKIIIPENIPEFTGVFSDEGLLKLISIQIFKLSEGTIQEIKNEDGTLDSSTFVQSGSNDSPLNLKNATLSLLNWTPKEDGYYRIRFKAINTLNYSNTLDIDVEVRNISIKLVQPPNENTYFYGGEISMEISTLSDSENNLKIYYDSNNDGTYSVDEKTFEKSYAKENISPDGIIKDSIKINNYDIFPNIGRYKIEVQREFNGKITNDYILFQLEDGNKFEIYSEKGLIIMSDTSINELVDNGFYSDRYYIPVKTEEGKNISDLNLQLKLLNYSDINNAKIRINNSKDYELDLISQEIDDKSKKRLYTFKTKILAEDVNLKGNTISVYINDKSSPSDMIDINLFTIGLNNPDINYFKLNIENSNNNQSYSLDKDNYESSDPNIEIIKDEDYSFSFSQGSFLDPLGVSEIEMYIINTLNGSTETIFKRAFDQVSVDNWGYNFNYNFMNNQGNYKLVIELRNSSYKYLENNNFPDYMMGLKEYTSKKIVKDIRILEVLDILGSIVFNQEDINNKGYGVISSKFPTLNMIIQNVDSLNKSKDSFNAYITQNGIDNKLSITEVNFAQKNEINRNFYLNVEMPDSVYDGEAKLSIEFENVQGKDFKAETQIIIDRESSYALPELEYDTDKNEIYLEIIEKFKYDIENIYFEIRGKGIVQSNILQKENIKYFYSLNDFYPGIYEIRPVIVDKNNNIFIRNNFKQIEIRGNMTVINNVNNYGLYRGIMALNDGDTFKFYNSNSFKSVLIEIDDQEITLPATSNKEYAYDIFSKTNPDEINSSFIRISTTNGLDERDIINLDLFKYDSTKEADIDSYNELQIYSNKNTGLNPLNIKLKKDIKVRAISIEDDGSLFENLSDHIFMSKTSFDNEFRLNLPDLRKDISEDKNINITLYDISGRTKEITKAIKIDTKKPEINNVNIINATLKDGVYEISKSDISSLKIEYSVFDDNISGGKVSIIVNDKIIDVDVSSTEYDFRDFDFMPKNEYEIYVYAEDSVKNFVMSEKKTLKIID
ncbi:hypothetical protein C7380_1252 [Oceanotoga teriensis]|uniref:Ig-like domain-containing protein n=1 Tax=Oceanotoga teriensis TaxID=515440 RepID=A0AA45HHJ6_9BACT|nr:hypothetical protein [Oceanotoga teriensis]PWJ87262.1 hypothetical protein C7380_1252 [Oceanotoga teriensis]